MEGEQLGSRAEEALKGRQHTSFEGTHDEPRGTKQQDQASESVRVCTHSISLQCRHCNGPPHQCQAGGDHCGQALWDGGHSQRHRDLEVVDGTCVGRGGGGMQQKVKGVTAQSVRLRASGSERQVQSVRVSNDISHNVCE